MKRIFDIVLALIAFGVLIVPFIVHKEVFKKLEISSLEYSGLGETFNLPIIKI